MPVAAPPPPATTQATPASTPAPVGGVPPQGTAPPDDSVDTTSWGDVNSDIDALDAEGQQTPPDDKGGKGKPEKPAAGQTQTPPDDKAGQAAAAAAAAAEADKTPSNIRDLRKGYEEQKKKIREDYEPKITRLEKELEEIRKSPQVTQTKEQQERFKALEARNNELEQVIRYVDYKKSKDYIENHLTPYNSAWEKARRDLAEVEVATANGGTRSANDADLMALAGMPLGAARRKANEMFGDSADDIMFHVRRISELSDAMTEAEKKFMAEAETKTQQQGEQSQIAAANRVKLWQAANKDLAEKYPRWFAPVNGDTEGNTLLDRGFALADLLFAPRTIDQARAALLPKSFRDEMAANNGRLSEQSVIKLHSLIRNKVANHDRLGKRANVLEKRVKELEKTLKEYEASEPTGRTAAPGAKGGAGGYLDEPNSELDKLDNPNL